ncbi:MAG: hypothetical protein P8Z40_13885 [Chloroflexota bacterium]
MDWHRRWSHSLTLAAALGLLGWLLFGKWGGLVVGLGFMERQDPAASGTDAANWCTNDGVTRNGQDAGGNPINGTPKAQNSCYQLPSGDQADLVVVKTGPLTAEPGSVITYGGWDGFGIALGDGGDKVILRDAGGQDVDAVVYGVASYAGIIPHPGGVEQ